MKDLLINEYRMQYKKATLETCGLGRNGVHKDHKNNLDS